jgi:hypothetical protein
MREAARILQASASVAELGALLVERDASFAETVVTNYGAYAGEGSPFEAMAHSGAGGFLLERYAGRLEPHTPWSFTDRDATMLFRGLVDPAEATVALADTGYSWLELLDNGILRRTSPTLDLPELRAYHLVPRGVNKASGVGVHMQRHGLGPEETAAVGDSLSDAQMAAVVGTTFIVGGGDASLRDRRPENVTLLEEPGGDGVARAVDLLLA